MRLELEVETYPHPLLRYHFFFFFSLIVFKLMCCIFIFIQFKDFSHFFVTACGILFPQSGIESPPPAVEAWSLNH